MRRMKDNQRRPMDSVNKTGSTPQTDDSPAGVKVAVETTDTVLAVLERITDGVFAFGRDWRCIHVNQAGARFIGDRAENCRGLTPQQLFPEAIGLPFFDAGRQAEATGKPAHVQAYYPPLGG